MPYSVDCRENGLYIVRMKPPITFEETMSAIKESENFIGSQCELWDLSIAGYDFTNDQLEALAQRAKAKPKRPRKTAILVSHDFQYGLSRVYSIHSQNDDTKLQVFRSEEEALIWLNDTE